MPLASAGVRARCSFGLTSMSAFFQNHRRTKTGKEIRIRDPGPGHTERCSPASWWQSAFAPATVPPRPHGDWFLVTHTREWNWWVRRARLSPPLAGVVAQPPCLQCFLHECVCACVFVLSIMIFIACSVVRVLVIFWDPVRLFMEDLKKHLFLNILINLYPAKLLYSNHSARWCVTPCRVSSYG